LPLLRTALAVCRARTDGAVDEFVSAVRQVQWNPTENLLRISLASGWLRDNPLMAADLRKTERQLKASPQTGCVLLDEWPQSKPG